MGVAMAVAIASCGGNASLDAEESTPTASTPTASTPDAADSTPAAPNPSEPATPAETTPAPVAATPNTTPPPAPLPAECSNPVDQATMNRCARAEYDQVDAELNQRYQAVKNSLSTDKQDVLVTAGRAWIEFRDANCEFVQLQLEGGSIQPMVYLG
ncbi:MAG: lysozyme inhibitor LprI family protein [Leptolyngbyaceae cyanobacterium]